MTSKKLEMLGCCDLEFKTENTGVSLRFQNSNLQKILIGDIMWFKMRAIGDARRG